MYSYMSLLVLLAACACAAPAPQIKDKNLIDESVTKTIERATVEYVIPPLNLESKIETVGQEQTIEHATVEHIVPPLNLEYKIETVGQEPQKRRKRFITNTYHLCQDGFKWFRIKCVPESEYPKEDNDESEY